jgi:hypothetical protein
MALKTTLRNAFWGCMEAMGSRVRPEKRIHMEFADKDDRTWWYNGVQGFMPGFQKQRTFKISLLLKKEDLPRLNGCPFPAKIGVYDEREGDFKTKHGTEYIAFLFMTAGDKLEDLENWARKRQFPHAAVLTHGHYENGKWTVKMVRKLTPWTNKPALSNTPAPIPAAL